MTCEIGFVQREIDQSGCEVVICAFSERTVSNFSTCSVWSVVPLSHLMSENQKARRVLSCKLHFSSPTLMQETTYFYPNPPTPLFMNTPVSTTTGYQMKYFV